MSERKGAVLFASTTPHLAVRVLDHVRKRWPEYAWTVCVKEQQRGWVPGDCPVICVPRWRPGLSARRRLRGGGFDLSIACWAGDKGYGRLKLLHLLTPARERHLYNENVDSFELRDEPDPSWARHLRWRLGASDHRPANLSGLLLRAYGATLGPVFGAVFLLGRHLLWSVGLGRRARHPAGRSAPTRA